MRAGGQRKRWRRPQPPDGLRRIPWGYLAAAIAAFIGPLFLFLLPLAQGSVCGPEPTAGCSLSVGLLLWLGGSLIGVLAATWVLRLGWLFALVFVAEVFALFRFADRVQNALTLILALLIPAVAAAATIPSSSPWHRSWQAWVAIVVSVGVIVWVSVWVVTG